MAGMRSFVRAHRKSFDSGSTYVVNIDSVGTGQVRFEVGEGPAVTYDFASRLTQLCHAIAEADEDGVPRYWAVLQDFDDGWYRSPTAAELDAQFERWAGSRMEGYFVYHWNEGGLESKPDHLAVLAKNNMLARAHKTHLGTRL